MTDSSEYQDDPPQNRYQKRKEAERQRNQRRSESGRNIGSPPPIKDPARRERGKKSGEAYLLEYFPDTFTLPFSDSHREVIKQADRIIASGGMQAAAMPRGSGKTSIFERLTLRALSYGFRKFAVILGANQDAAEEILDTLKIEILTNDRLAEDFPEICHPFRALEEISNRAKGQHIDGLPTGVKWHRKTLIFPVVEGSAASGAILEARGILARIRGMKVKSRTGEELRPDLVIPDDPQTDNSARSPYQVTKRLKVLRGTVLGLAGPSKSIAAFCPCTVIEPNDLASHLLDRELCPEWHGQTIPMLLSMPKNKDLWNQYWDLRAVAMRADLPDSDAVEFYRKNRKKMDQGAKSTWPERFNEGEISAIQHAMNLIQDRGEDAFWAEFQQKPRGAASNDISLWFLEPKQIAAKIWTPADGEDAPDWSTTLVAYVDVQQQLLYWVVGAFGDRFRGYICDYNTWPKQDSPYFRYANARIKFADCYPGRGVEESITLALDNLINYLSSLKIKTSNGVLRIAKIGIDSGFRKESAHEMARKHGSFVLPCKGQPIDASNRPLSEYSTETGAINGHHWRETPHKLSSRLLHIDTNYWKTRVHTDLATTNTDRDSLRLPANRIDNNENLISHLRSEEPVETFGQGRRVVVWKHPPNKPDNHWFDCASGVMAIASRLGIKSDPNSHRKSRGLTASEIAEYNQRARQRRQRRY